MKVKRVYLDHNATAPLRPEARDAMREALEIFGNPSSVHEEGRKARAAVERARAQVAAFAGCEPGEVVFTSGASEANQTVIGSGFDLIAVSAVEHESVLAAGRARAAAAEGQAQFVEIPVARDGTVDLSHLADVLPALQRQGQSISNPLISVQMANGETGVLQPLEQVVEAAREQGYAIHTDAVQAAGRIPLDFHAADVDFLSISAHKIGGPKGVGALIVREGRTLDPLIRGGGQERGRRSGTENVPGIVGFGAAAQAAQRDLEQMPEIARLRDRLEEEAVALSGGRARVIAAGSPRLPNTAALALEGAKAETLVIALDLAGIAVSAGSACSSGKATRSHVLQAMGLAPELADATLRVSLGWNSCEADVERFLQAWRTVAGGMKESANKHVA
ncbi:MAG: cysteine desulfurase family protein [Methyloligellaceae bacterium]